MDAQTAYELYQAAFGKDNFSSRRTTGNNGHDPNSLITGGEIAQGLDYNTSIRVFPSFEHWERAASGEMSTDEILRLAPRVPFDWKAAAAEWARRMTL